MKEIGSGVSRGEGFYISRMDKYSLNGDRRYEGTMINSMERE